MSMTMLRYAANYYRLAAEAFAEGSPDSVIQYYLTEARYYDTCAVKGPQP